MIPLPYGTVVDNDNQPLDYDLLKAWLTAVPTYRHAECPFSFHSLCLSFIYRKDWFKSYALQTFMLDDYDRVCKSIILWSKTKANCDRRRAFDDSYNFIIIVLKKNEEIFSIVTEDKYNILRFILEAVIHSTSLKKIKSTKQIND